MQMAAVTGLNVDNMIKILETVKSSKCRRECEDLSNNKKGIKTNKKVKGLPDYRYVFLFLMYKKEKDSAFQNPLPVNWGNNSNNTNNKIIIITAVLTFKLKFDTIFPRTWSI